MTRRAALGMLGLLATVVATAAATTVPNQALRELAETALRAQYDVPDGHLEVASGPLDARLHLPGCPMPLRASVPSRRLAARVAVQVSCPVPGGWSLRVPVKLRWFRPVLVTVRPLARGDSINASDVRSEERDVTQLGYGYIDTLQQIGERSLARPLSAGSVLTPAMLNGRQLVRAGDAVQLIARLDGIEVRTDGQALNGGDSGARLRVRNAHSGRVVDAVVLAAGEVRALP